MKLGAEPKKVAILGGLVIVLGAVAWFNLRSDDSGSSPAPRPAAAAVPSPAVSVPVPATARSAQPTLSRDDRRRAKNGTIINEFTFRQGTEPGAEKPDPASIDPTLRLDLLAKLQQVEAPEALRNVFQYGSAPPPPSAKPVDLPKNTPKIAINQAPPPPSGPPPPPPEPKAPPMTFKYYGYKVSRADGRKEAFLLDGEDIIIAGENDAMKSGRYKIVSIGVNSITIEDTQFRSTQTLQLQPDAVV